MARTLTLWRTLDDFDQAGSDEYWPSRSQALAFLKEAYGVKATALVQDPALPDRWQARWEGHHGDGYGVVTLERLEIRPTRKGIAAALKYIPMR